MHHFRWTSEFTQSKLLIPMFAKNVEIQNVNIPNLGILTGFNCCGLPNVLIPNLGILTDVNYRGLPIVEIPNLGILTGSN